MFSRFNLSGLTEEFLGGKNACKEYQSYYKNRVLPLKDINGKLIKNAFVLLDTTANARNVLLVVYDVDNEF